MEYGLLKTISPQLMNYMPHTPYVNLTSTPSIDLINPGLGQISRLYSFYTPLSGIHSPYQISKLQKNVNKIDQKGYGENEIKDQEIENASNIDTKDKEIPNEQEIQSITDKKNSELSDGLLDSFQHPSIKVKQVVFNSAKSGKSTFSKSKELKQRQVKVKSLKSHNFSII